MKVDQGSVYRIKNKLVKFVNGIRPIDENLSLTLLKGNINFFPEIIGTNQIDYQSLTSLDFAAKDLCTIYEDKESSFVGRILAARGFNKLAAKSFESHDFTGFEKGSIQSAWSYDHAAKTGLRINRDLDLPIAICGWRSAKIYSYFEKKEDYAFATRRVLMASINSADIKTEFEHKVKDQYFGNPIWSPFLVEKMISPPKTLPSPSQLRDELENILGYRFEDSIEEILSLEGNN